MRAAVWALNWEVASNSLSFYLGRCGLEIRPIFVKMWAAVCALIWEGTTSSLSLYMRRCWQQTRPIFLKMRTTVWVCMWEGAANRLGSYLWRWKQPFYGRCQQQLGPLKVLTPWAQACEDVNNILGPPLVRDQQQIWPSLTSWEQHNVKVKKEHFTLFWSLIYHFITNISKTQRLGERRRSACRIHVFWEVTLCSKVIVGRRQGLTSKKAESTITGLVNLNISQH